MGMFIFVCSAFDEALPRRYAIDMCPTANKQLYTLTSQIVQVTRLLRLRVSFR
jgi:hypothetical protein